MEEYDEEYGEATLIQIIDEELHSLDLFNLEVAKFRVKYSMPRGIIHLYGAMGRLSGRLMALKSKAEEIEIMWNNTIVSFQLLRDKEEKE